ncbi:Trace amine-associated receptor 8a [Collichthys lucidus]|uniref:Trace amine-associated receptor 8a n=1 Tax=Collichthys lucidus TaxID=240159 RepID=A0A4U5U4J4_COLLU|nr:Trace amine-associated receptor 8a [Collichthys lucidus]
MSGQGCIVALGTGRFLMPGLYLNSSAPSSVRILVIQLNLPVSHFTFLGIMVMYSRRSTALFVFRNPQKQLHTPTNFILLSLAFSDFFVGFLMAFQIVAGSGCWSLGDILCPLYLFLAYIITSASIRTMVIISIDRYVAICHPLHYSTQMTQKRVQVCICLCWICSVIFQGILQNHTMKLQDTNPCSRECMIVVDYDSVLADLIFSFIVPITIIVLLYMRVFVVAVSQAHAMRSHIATVTFQKTGKVMAKKSELKAARTLRVVIVDLRLFLSMV